MKQLKHIYTKEKIMINIRSLVLVLGIFATGCDSCTSVTPLDAAVDATVAQDVVVEAAVDVPVVADAAPVAVDATVAVDAARD
jgi:hypothetical protein